jgi:beta-lactamase class A
MKEKKFIAALALVITAAFIAKYVFPAQALPVEETVSVSAQEAPASLQDEGEAVSDLLESKPVLKPEVEAFGGYEPTQALLTALDQEISAIQAQGSDVAFSLMDIQTGQGLQYNQSMPFYGASTIKGPYAVALAMQDFDAANSAADLIEDVTVASSNDNYWNLQMQFGMEPYQALCQAAGIDAVTHTGGFTFFNSDELARLWMVCDRYLTTDAHGPEVAAWLDHPDSSAIRDAVGDRYLTWTEAGWYFQDESDETDYRAANDAGIVRAGDYPYVIAVMSDIPGELDKLVPLVRILDEIHQDMVG